MWSAACDHVLPLVLGNGGLIGIGGGLIGIGGRLIGNVGRLIGGGLIEDRLIGYIY